MGLQINQYPIEAFDIADKDFYDVDKNIGASTWESQKISGETLKASILALTAKNNGSFYSSITQYVASGNIAAMSAGNVFYTPTGIVIVNDTFGNPTLIQVTKDGNYNVQFSAQLNRTSGGSSKQISIWLRKNGTDLANSATHLSVQANAGKLVAAWNFFIDINIGDSVQLMWSQNDSIDIISEAADVVVPHPAVPSVIITVNEL